LIKGHAAPTELELSFGAWCYKHGAPTEPWFREEADKTYLYNVKVPKEFVSASQLDFDIVPQTPVRKEYVVEPLRPPSLAATDRRGLR